MRQILILTLSAFLVSCMTLGMMTGPGSISERKSEFDKFSTASMQPAYIYDGLGVSLLRLGLTWKSDKPDMYLITATYGSLVSVPAENSLEFKIGEQIIRLSDLPASLTEHRVETVGYSVVTWSTRHYITDRKTLEQIALGDRVLVRFGGFFEAVFSQDRMQAAQPAFREFLARTAPKTSF